MEPILVSQSHHDLVHVQEKRAGGVGMVSIPLSILVMTSSAYFLCGGVLKSRKFLQERMACLEWAKAADVGQRILVELRSRVGRKIGITIGPQVSVQLCFLLTQPHGISCWARRAAQVSSHGRQLTLSLDSILGGKEAPLPREVSNVDTPALVCWRETCGKRAKAIQWLVGALKSGTTGPEIRSRGLGNEPEGLEVSARGLF